VSHTRYLQADGLMLLFMALADQPSQKVIILICHRSPIRWWHGFSLFLNKAYWLASSGENICQSLHPKRSGLHL